MASQRHTILSRREFLGVAGVSAAAFAWGCGGASSLTPLNGDFDVIVIGAGIGGMSAAQALRSHKRVLVLEARNRVGGRAWSNNTFPQAFDYGAQYFDMCKPKAGGGTENPLYDIALAKGVRTAPEGVDAFLMKNGIPKPDESMAVGENLFLMDAAIKAAGQLAAAGGVDVSAAEACAALASRPFWDLATSIMINQRDFMEHLSSQDYYNQSLLMDAPIGGASTQTFLVPDGLGNFIATFADGLDIRFNMPANVVDTRDANLVKVETDAGTVTARHVVVAVPQSIIANERLQFKPGLAAMRMAGFHKVPMYTVDKIGIEFSSDVFELFNDNTLVGQYVETGVRSASIVTKFMGKRQASIIFGGDTALEVEAGGMPAFQDYARATIADVFGSDTANAISRIAVNPWGADPWAGGSWTMADVGAAPERLEIGKPIDNRIFFAGEPYTQEMYGTTQAAYATGQAAAAAILAL